MFGLFLIFLVVFFSLTVIFWATTLSIQGYIYSEPTTGLEWRSPAAGAALTGFLAFWCFLDYRALDPNAIEVPFDTIFRFAPFEAVEVDTFWAVFSNDQEVEFTRYKTARGIPEYRDKANNPWRREDSRGIVKAILVQDKADNKLRFEPRLTNDGKFPATAEQFPGYYQVNGRRVMEQIGRVTWFRWGLFLGNVILNGLSVAVWFVCLWLLLRYQWPHALGLTVVTWLVVTLTVMPMLLSKTQDVARQRATTACNSFTPNSVCA